MQCVVLSATCGGALVADGVARRTSSSAVRSDAAYQSIPHDGPAALQGKAAGAQTFVCVRSALRRWPVALRLHGRRRSDAVTRREHGREPHVAGEDTVKCDAQQELIVGAVAASGTSHVPQHNGVCGPEAREEGDGEYCDSIAGVRNYHEPSFRSAATSTYSIANRAAEPVETPDVCKYKKLGSDLFCALCFGMAATGVVWLHYLTTMYLQQYFCDQARPTLPCDTHVAS
ncbi:unnamed protein product [Hyaloperonospora brassicae]|uniref:RxLR effector candidate protein n=1 Tax=Hyaloperonospora brassicae TaxID=162125 RepID=A0AAV0U7H7_HYABA|nr:unnamed protein product [Hyaloperonospora brassicae]